MEFTIRLEDAPVFFILLVSIGGYLFRNKYEK
jgi:hypothetical protein